MNLKYAVTALVSLFCVNEHYASAFAHPSSVTNHSRSVGSNGNEGRHGTAFLTPRTTHNSMQVRGGGSSPHASTASSAEGTTCLSESVASFITEQNWALLSSEGQAALASLIEADADFLAQKHVYADWPEAGVEDEGKIRLCNQLASLDSSYPGGLAAYLKKARVLLKESADGTNPFTDFESSVPEGESLSYDSPSPDSHTGMTFSEAEESGLTGIADVAFVLVAGGLGERLGYSGIKLSLETNLLTNKSYLEVYAKYIQAMQRMAEKKTGRSNVRLPLVIMTSGDTDPATRQLLADNNNFGFEDGQVQIVCQDKVAALNDVNAGLSLGSDRWEDRKSVV